MKSRRSRHSQAGFTLIEVLIVVVILGILAALVIPQYVDTTDETHEAAIRQQLQTLRSQIVYYNFKENGYPASLEALADAGYVASAPEHPEGGNWVYDPDTGQLASSLDGSW